MTDRLNVNQINSDQLDRLYDERDRYRTAILDIDAHATPIGQADPNDPDGNPHHYAVTVGALHRALGKIGHTAPICTAEAEVARLRAGEEDDYTEHTVPTPGQWIHQFNHATAEKRLEVIAALLDAAERAHTCFLMAHERRLDEDRQAWVTLARVRDVRAKWALYTLEPGQVRRLLDDLTHALAEPANNSEQPARTTPDNPTASGNHPDNPHVYLSTGCLHNDHAYCQAMTGLNGAKRPGECKFCQAPCRCFCHREGASRD